MYIECYSERVRERVSERENERKKKREIEKKKSENDSILQTQKLSHSGVVGEPLSPVSFEYLFSRQNIQLLTLV